MIDAVLFDLDDTLYDQHQWLAGAWDAVCQAAERLGVDGPALRRELDTVASEGTSRGGIIDLALARVGADIGVAPLVTAFREHRPPALDPYPGAVAAVQRLRERVLVGLVTDGDVGIQRGKIDALGLADAFDTVVVSDELGRERRKPHAAPFLLALSRLGVEPHRTVFIGDHPEKDVVGPQAVGMAAVRVLSGEYAPYPDLTQPWAVVANIEDAAALVDDAMAATAAVAGRGRRDPRTV